MQTFHEPLIHRPCCLSLSVVAHPWAGTKLHPSKGIPRLGRDNRKLHNQQEGVPPRRQITHTTHSLSFPTFLSNPRKYTPLLSNNPSTAPLLFQGFNNRLDQEFLEHYSCCWAPSRRTHFPNNLSHLDRVSHRPDNLLLQSQQTLSHLERVVHMLDNLLLQTSSSTNTTTTVS
jgi:hypothetical protein